MLKIDRPSTQTKIGNSRVGPQSSKNDVTCHSNLYARNNFQVWPMYLWLMISDCKGEW